MRINRFTADEAFQLIIGLAKQQSAAAGAAEGTIRAVVERLYAGGGFLGAIDGTPLFQKTVPMARQQQQQQSHPQAPHISPSVPPELVPQIRQSQPTEGAAFGPSEFAEPKDLG